MYERNSGEPMVYYIGVYVSQEGKVHSIMDNICNKDLPFG